MLFAVTGLFFWIMFSVALILLFIAVAAESSWYPVLIIGLFLGCLYVFGYRENVTGLWQDITGDPWKYVIYFLIYIVIGVAYSFVKWYFLLIDRRDYIMESIREGHTVYDRKIPKAGDNKDKLFRWIFYWPISMALVIIDRPFRRIFKFIYNKLSGAYEAMGRSVFSGIPEPKKKEGL